MKPIDEEDWDLLNEILHDDFTFEGSEVDVSKAQFALNPAIEFMKLLHVDQEITEGLETMYLQPVSKKHQIRERKLISKILVDWKITDIKSQDDRVWVSRIATIRDPQNLKITLSSIMKFWFKDGQIIRSQISGRYLNSLIQFGKIVVERDLKDELKHYLDGLR